MHELPRSVREFEPLIAIDGGAEGVDFIKRMILGSHDHLGENGVLALEIDEESVNTLKKFLLGNRVGPFRFYRDMFNRNRYLFTGAINEEG
jgi:release factor glutamine methyltransferase